MTSFTLRFAHRLGLAVYSVAMHDAPLPVYFGGCIDREAGVPPKRHRLIIPELAARFA